MIDIATFAAYVLVVLGLFLIPGPAILLTLGRAASGGARVGVATGLGIATGDVVHATMAVCGLSEVLVTSALAFEIVKYAGVAYLTYLGIQSFLKKEESLEIPAIQAMTVGRAFCQAILTEVINPKTALFFLAFLPQFVHPGNGPIVLQLCVFGLTFVAMSTIYTSLIALCAGSFARWLARHRNIGRWQGKIIGTIYLALGIRLAFEER